MNQVVVVGGGAAGVFGAIACAEANPSARITVLEAGRSPLSKVKISGGGRCNVTHACFAANELVTYYPRGHRALRGAFQRFQPENTVEWFFQRGVPLKTEGDGRMFPTTDDSQTIIDCLLKTASQYHIDIRTRTPVASVERVLDSSPTVSATSATRASLTFSEHPASPDYLVSPKQLASSEQLFRVKLKSGKTLRCDRLLLATGSHPSGQRMAQTLGHTIETPVPSLFTFTIADTHLRSLAGVAIDPVQVRLVVEGCKPLEQEGALLITHWGMSGPAILKLSAWGARMLYGCGYRAILRVNWLPSLNHEALRQQLQSVKQHWARKAIATASPFSMPRRFWRYILHRAAIDQQIRWADLSKVQLHRLTQTLLQDQYDIAGKGVFKDEFVTCGGVRLKEINFKTMESRHCPGLFLAGEILDVDGVTGGFNFQSAWTTGWLAGQALAASF
ncbi:MAG: NAD(P)/FAD-dependent oxidoreductase [Merismopedia sp. SIO2A8]|nr:NAD(P)/FAD-dependent oxidoreductase [Merismopedia sp. SIO2A8]